MPSKKKDLRMKDEDDAHILVILERYSLALRDNESKCLRSRKAGKHVENVYQNMFTTFMKQIDRRRRIMYEEFVQHVDTIIDALNMLYKQKPIDNDFSFSETVKQRLRDFVSKYSFTKSKVNENSSTQSVPPNPKSTVNEKTQPRIQPKTQSTVFLPNYTYPTQFIPQYNPAVHKYVPILPAFIPSVQESKKTASVPDTYPPNGNLSKPSQKEIQPSKTVSKVGQVYRDYNGPIVFENCNVTINTLYTDSNKGSTNMQICSVDITPQEVRTNSTDHKYTAMVKKLDSLLERIQQRKRQHGEM